jgi:hypothetical protein
VLLVVKVDNEEVCLSNRADNLVKSNYSKEILNDYEVVVEQMNMSDRLFEVIWSSE